PRNCFLLKRSQQKHTLYRCERTMVESSIFASRELRAAWPRQAAIWARQHPGLFDQDDLRLTRTQPKNHFAEWFAAVHLFQAENLRSLVQKYLFDDAHPQK